MRFSVSPISARRRHVLAAILLSGIGTSVAGAQGISLTSPQNSILDQESTLRIAARPAGASDTTSADSAWLSEPVDLSKSSVAEIGKSSSSSLTETATSLKNADPIRSDVLDSVSVAQSLETIPAGEPETIEQRFANGKVKVTRDVVLDDNGNYVQHGPYIEYDQQGKVIRSGQYNMGKQDGEWMQQVDSESLRRLTNTIDGGFRAPFESRANFENGKLQGIWTAMDSKGNPIFVWQFADGMRDNSAVWYNSRGDLIREILYSKNVANGPAVIKPYGAQKPQNVELIRGKIVKTDTQWYDGRYKRRKKSEQSVLIPMIAELLDHDWWNSRIAADLEPNMEPTPHGAVVQYHPNGQIAMEGNYSDGKQDGVFTWYYENAQKKKRGSFASDMRTGQWVWWHANGMKSSLGQFDADTPSGTWSAWAMDGRLTKQSPGESVASIPFGAEDSISSDTDSETSSPAMPSTAKRVLLPPPVRH